MLNTLTYCLYPTKRQERLLDQQLEARRWLYTYLLAARRDAREQRQQSLCYYDQAVSLPALKAERHALATR